MIEPVIATQVPAWGAGCGCDGAAFLLAGARMALAAAILLAATPRLAGHPADGAPGCRVS